jgi:hypothetical protein
VTLNEVKVVFLYLAAATSAAVIAGHYFGLPGYLGGFATVFALPILVFGLFFFANPRLLLTPEDVPLPPCVCGASSREFSRERSEQHFFIDRCSCGRAYLQSGGNVLLYVQPDALHPYMTWVRFRGWRPIDGALNHEKPYP